MEPPENLLEENRRLRRTMRELVAISTLPAVWIGLGPDGIVRSLADVLINTLSLDLICIRLAGLAGERDVEVIRSKHGLDPADFEVLRTGLAPLLRSDRTEPPDTIPDPFGKGTLHVAVTRFGVGDDDGVLITGSRNPDFPTELDRLLLGVGANQTAIVVQRRRAEERLHEQQEWLRVTLASIGDAVIATDAQGEINFLNSVAEGLTGWTLAEAQGKSLEKVFAILHEQTRQPVESPVEKVLREGAVVGLGNHTVLLAKDGTKRPIEDSAAPIRDATGKIIGVVLIFRDVAEQRRTEQHRNARLAVTQVLTQAATVQEAAVGVLRAMGESLGWDVGFFWTVNDDRSALVCRESWHRTEVPVSEFENDSCRRSFRRGEGLPGHVWSAGKPAWIVDVTQDDNFPRTASAAKYELHSALACPVIVGDQTLGVIEFFTKRIREPDAGLLEMLATIAGHVGQFIERKLAEDQLRQRGEELADFFENATVGLHWVGPDGVILRANQAELDMLGYRREEYVGRHIADFHSDEDVICDILKRLQAGEKLRDYPARLRCKDGSLKDVLIDSSVLWKNGQFIHTRCFTRDVTERNRAEAKVREQQQRTRIVLESITDAFFALDQDWRFTYINPQAERLLDRKPGDLLGRILWEEYPGLVGSEFEQAYRHVASDRSTLSVTSYYPDHDRWYEAHVYPATDGISIYFRDVSERERAEAELTRLMGVSEQQRRIYETALSNTADFNYVFDLQGRFVYINEALLALWGKEFHEAVGKNFFELDYPPSLAERLQRQIQSVIDTRQPLRSETPYMSALGEREYEYIFMPVVAADGSVEAVAGSTRDITDRKRLEKELQLRVDQLADADRRKDEFLATLAHELRNPLAPIRTGLEVMKLARDDPDTIEEIRNTMERQTEQLITLVGDLLDVSRITRGKLELRKCRVRLSDVVQSAVEASEPFIDEARHRFTITVPKSPIYLNADPHRLAQILSNLLNNAAKYTPDGGQIWLTAERQGSDAVVSVRDTGIGIPADMLDRIFEMFAQIDRTMEKACTGLGIGLTLVKSLTELHGGRIEVQSDGPNQGSVFSVRLPLLMEMPATQGEPSQVDERVPKLSKRRVLVVDDNKAAADTLSMVVRMLGNEVRTAGDGQQAIEVAAEFLPDAILMDLGMPRLSGYEAARHIRQQPWGEKMMLVALTGWGQDEDKQRTKEAGFNYHLVKPAEPSHLQSLLAELDHTAAQ